LANESKPSVPDGADVPPKMPKPHCCGLTSSSAAVLPCVSMIVVQSASLRTSWFAVQSSPAGLRRGR